MDRNGLDIRTSLRIGRDLRIPLPRPATPPPPSHNPGSQPPVNYGAPDVPIGDSGGTGTGQSVIQEASKYLGTPYVWSGTSLTGGIDCSGFTMQVYAMFGISLPHRAAEQAQCGVAVEYSDLQPGDLVLFHTTRSGISHVGMYIGSGDFIHSSSHMGGVVISPLDSGYYNERFVCARRVL
jgi:cell wall-associated NlpC family hydrolase